MKKLIALFILFGVVLATPSYAAGTAAAPSLWESLRKKIEAMTPKKKLVTTTAAGGVRGALADADDLYWKGESEAVDEDELSAFKKAIALIDTGDKLAAQAAFADFIKQSPDSPLRGDAETALAQLKTGK
ncbi:MAG: hypothetical protein PHQ60_06640 [Sideroxydans sp.]|nr:hypothetical protein [Sideroxydans sp.]